MEKKRDIFISPQQWAAERDIELTPEVKNIIFLLWKDLQVEIKFLKQRIKSLEIAKERQESRIKDYARALRRK